MTLIPDPPPSNKNNISVANPSLEIGLAAVKQGNYATAIAHLEAICEIELHEPSILRAQMGLVVAYERNSQPLQAIALCQTLYQSDNRQVKEWATRTLSSLTQRYPQQLESPSNTLPPPPPPAANPTGFVPFDNPPEKQNPEDRKRHKPEVASQNPKAEDDNKDNQILPSPSPSPSPSLSWRNAGRAKKMRPLKVIKKWRYFVLQSGVAIALFLLMRAVFQVFLSTTNDILLRLPLLEPIQDFYYFYYAPNPPLLIFLGVLLVACPWLMDGLLHVFYAQQPLSMDALATHSPEAVKTIKSFCFKKNLPRPNLRLLPTDAPVALTYGNLPHTARIVVSQGLLDRLTDDEIATIYAGELGHIVNWDFIVMSLAVLVVQIPYLIYWQVAQKSDNWKDVNTLLIKGLRVTASVISAIAYGLYRLLRLPVLWLSRQRLFYSDRLACELTGNPNALTRALLKIALGIASDIQQQQQTSHLLESFDLLMPVGHQQAITSGSFHALTPLASLLEWDRSNPYRRWLTLNNSHPPIGDRLHVLDQIARFWNVETELDWAATPSAASNQRPNRKILLLQGAPFFGIAAGFAIGVFVWLLGWISVQMHFRVLSWIMRDYQWIFNGLLMTGFSLGTIWRLNRFFPDIKPSTLPAHPNLPTLLTNPAALPLDSQPIRLEGKLLGRRGIGNWLGQDLLIEIYNLQDNERKPNSGKTTRALSSKALASGEKMQREKIKGEILSERTSQNPGLVKLHYIYPLGPIGYFWPQSARPSDLINRQIVVTGWFRRGATPWIDVETLSSTGRLISYSGHPMWSTIFAGAIAVWGVYSIAVGGL